MLSRALLLSRVGRAVCNRTRSLAAPTGRVAWISTSGRRSDTAAVAQPTPQTKQESIVTEENWVSYGFDHESKEDDENWMHAVFFFTVSLVLVGGGFYLAYQPDSGRDWASREAFLELRRREAAGMPLIDRNYVSADLMELPSDEELGNTEIII